MEAKKSNRNEKQNYPLMSQHTGYPTFFCKASRMQAKREQQHQQAACKQKVSKFLISEPQKAPGARDCWFFLQLSKQKKHKRTDPQANFKFLALKERPEHETVGIFAIFYDKKCLELCVFWYLLNGSLKITSKNTTKQIHRITFCPPHPPPEEAKKKKTLDHSLDQ